MTSDNERRSETTRKDINYPIAHKPNALYEELACEAWPTQASSNSTAAAVSTMTARSSS